MALIRMAIGERSGTRRFKSPIVGKGWKVQFEKFTLVSAAKWPIRKAEKGRADHHHLRAHREQGTPKEKTPVAEEEVALKAATMMMLAEQQIMLNMLFMAGRDKEPKVVVGAKELFVLEVIKVAKPLEAGVTEAPVKASQRANTPRKMAHPWATREASPESSYAMGPDPGSEKL